MRDRLAWEYIGSDGIKRCPNCGATELEGMEICSECGRGPFEDREWRAQGRSADHVMRRAEFEVMVGRACRPRSGDADHVEACEDRRERLLNHDAALRDRLDRLSVERAHDEAMRDALERIALECESEAMDCECAPPGNGEACPRCEIKYVARESVELIGTSQEVVG